MTPSKETSGVFDGLTIDAVGNVWAARWKDQRVIGYTPGGEMIGMIRVPGCKSPTIPCFGGESFLYGNKHLFLAARLPVSGSNSVEELYSALDKCKREQADTTTQ